MIARYTGAAQNYPYGAGVDLTDEDLVPKGRQFGQAVLGQVRGVNVVGRSERSDRRVP
jgi:hypothetical protein